MVANSGDNTASIFNGYSASPTPTVVPTGSQPTGVAISPNDDSTFVTNFDQNSNTVTEFTANSTAMPATASVGWVHTVLSSIPMTRWRWLRRHVE